MSNNKYLPLIIARVKASKISVPILAEETGLKERWLYDVLAHKTPNASYEKIKTLEVYLDKHINTLVLGKAQ